MITYANIEQNMTKTEKKDCATQGCQNDAKRGYSMSNGEIWLCPECDIDIKGWAFTDLADAVDLDGRAFAKKIQKILDD